MASLSRSPCRLLRCAAAATHTGSVATAFRTPGLPSPSPADPPRAAGSVRPLGRCRVVSGDVSDHRAVAMAPFAPVRVVTSDDGGAPPHESFAAKAPKHMDSTSAVGDGSSRNVEGIHAATASAEGSGGNGRKRRKMERKRKNRTAVITSSSFPWDSPYSSSSSASPQSLVRYPELAEGERTEGADGRGLPLLRPPFPADFLPSGIEAAVYVRPLLVLDLNGILCRRLRRVPSRASVSASGSSAASSAVPCAGNSEPCLEDFRPPVGNVAGTPVVARTDLDPFLYYLAGHFTLAVWTSATRKTARKLVDMLVPLAVRRRLLFVWGQDRCEAKARSSKDENKKKGEGNPPGKDQKEKQKTKQQQPGGETYDGRHKDTIFIKALSKVWEAYPLWDESNTVLMDDSPDKCPERFLGNTVHPPPILGLRLKKMAFSPASAKARTSASEEMVTISCAGAPSPSSSLPAPDDGGAAAEAPLVGTERNSTVPAVQSGGEELEFEEDGGLGPNEEDSENQRMQTEFFRDLAQFWASGDGERGGGDGEKLALRSKSSSSLQGRIGYGYRSTVASRAEARCVVEANGFLDRKSGKEGLFSFLQRRGTGHMGWRGGEDRLAFERKS